MNPSLQRIKTFLKLLFLHPAGAMTLITASQLEHRAASHTETLRYQGPFAQIINPLPPTRGALTLHLAEKKNTVVKRKMRDNAERLFYFKMPIKDNVTSKSSSAVITVMPKASQMCSKRLMACKGRAFAWCFESPHRFRILHPSLLSGSG